MWFIFVLISRAWKCTYWVASMESRHKTVLKYKPWCWLFHSSFWNACMNPASRKKKSSLPPRRGIEPRSPAWQAGILTTILTRNCTNKRLLTVLLSLLTPPLHNPHSSICLTFLPLLLQFSSKLNGTKIKAFTYFHLLTLPLTSISLLSPPLWSISIHFYAPRHTYTLPESKAHALSHCTMGLVVPSMPHRTLCWLQRTSFPGGRRERLLLSLPHTPFLSRSVE